MNARLEPLKNFMVSLKTEKFNESKAIFQEVKKREAEENSIAIKPASTQRTRGLN